jgi:hypothetical protein
MRKLLFSFFILVFVITNAEAQNVGIGTPSPQSELHLHSGTSSFNLQLTNNITSAAVNRGGNIRMLGGNLFINNQETNGSIFLRTNNLPGLAITKFSGRNFIGIGIDNPQSTLHVHNDSPSEDESIQITNSGTPTSANLGARLRLFGNEFQISNYKNGKISFGFGLLPVLSVFPNNNVGIGLLLSETAQAPLHVRGDGEASRIQGNNAYQTFYDGNNYRGYMQAWTDALGIGATTGNALKFYTQSGTERMTILDDGNIGIGTSGPIAPLEVRKSVNGTVRLVEMHNEGSGNGLRSSIEQPSFISTTGISAIEGRCRNGIGMLGVAEEGGWGMFGSTISGRAVYGSGKNGIGVYGRADHASTGVAGYFYHHNNGVAIEIEGSIKVSGANKPVFQHVATAANTNVHETVIPNTTFANSATDLLIITPYWDGVYINATLGVYFLGGTWRIFRQDLAPMPIGAKFNVMVVKQ